LVLRKIVNIFGILSIAVTIFSVGAYYYHNYQVEQELQKANPEWLARDVYDYLNYDRRITGREPFNWDKDLAKIAVEHSTSMRDGDYVEHDEPGGLTFQQRIEALGQNYEGLAAAENLLMLDHPFSVDDIGGLTYQSWLGSHQHLVIMMDPAYSKVGVGVAIKGGQIYITADFSG